jgi:hypothetical protein
VANSYFLVRDGVFLGVDISHINGLKYWLLGFSGILFFIAVLDLLLLTGLFIEVRKLSASTQRKDTNEEITIRAIDVLEFRIDGNTIQETHQEIIQVTKSQPLSAISLHNISESKGVGKIKACLVFPSCDFQLTTSDNAAEIIENNDGCTELVWEIGSLEACDNAYIKSLKVDQCLDGEHELKVRIEVEDTVAFERKFKINVIPNEEVKN